MKKVCLLIILTYCAVFESFIHGQITIGVISNSPSSYGGYTLLSPNSSNEAYLIDNCGYVVNSWSTGTRPALSAYLLENGDLLRTGKVSNPVFSQGGVGGAIQRFDWNGNLLWDYTFSSNSYCQHHDIEYLPNGNVLILATELKTQADCIAAGRNPALLADGELWPEFLVEVRPIGIDSGEIVWEWHSWDHLVQDFDNTKANYQATINVPELLDVNYDNNASKADFMHANSVAYNAELDQIVLSCKNWSELWVIDHSTTTAEAASHSGGNRGKGGDLIYRWGNPANYGGIGAKMLEDQHDVHWIASHNPDSGKIMIFNNGRDRGWSSIDVITPPIDSLGNYQFASNTYGPSTLYWTYVDTVAPIFNAFRISGAHQLPNGNYMICAGTTGELFEVDNQKNTVWEYVNPVFNSGIATQGDVPGLLQNSVFRAYRYGEDYPGFIGKTLTPTTPIELNYNTSHCSLFTSQKEIAREELEILIYPNPATKQFSIQTNSNLEGKIFNIYNLFGDLILESTLESYQTLVNVEGLAKGTYFVKIEDEGVYKIILL